MSKISYNNCSTTKLLSRVRPQPLPPATAGYAHRLLLPAAAGRQCGGLRTRGYFKHNYQKIAGEWWITDRNNQPLERIALPDNITISGDKLPLVAVITVVYNGEQELESTIISILEQNYPNVEYIIVDGGSTDNTLDIIKRYEDKIDYWVSESDHGIYNAMNKGTELSNAQWVNYMNAGDKFCHSRVIEELHLDSQHAEVIYGKVFLVDAAGLRQLVEPAPWNKKSLYHGMPFCHQAAFISSRAFAMVGLYDESYKIAADHDWVTRLYLGGGKGKYQDTDVAEFTVGGVSTSYRAKLEDIRIAYRYFSKTELCRRVIASLIGIVKIFILRHIIGPRLHRLYRKLKYRKFYEF